MPSVLRESNFRLLLIGRSMSRLGDGAAPVALAFAVLDMTRSGTDLGYVLAARLAPTAILLIVGGVWADRLPRQLVMCVADLVRLACQATIAVLLVTGRATVLEIGIATFFYGCASAFYIPASTGLIQSIVSDGQLQEANALITITSGTSLILGPALAGVLIAAFSTAAVFFVDAGTFAVSVATLIVMRIPRRPAESDSSGFLAELREGWMEVVTRTWLWVTIAAQCAMFLLVIGPYSVLGPVIAQASLGGPSAWALISAAFAIGQLGGGVVAFRWRPRRPLLAGSAAVLLEGPPMALLAAGAPAPLIAVAQLVGGAGISFFLTIWNSELQRDVPADRLARVSAYDWLGTVILLPLSYPAAGAIAAVVGPSPVLWFSAAAVPLIIVPLLIVRQVRTFGREPLAINDTAHIPQGGD
jgi:predicted MFS family arabinose efflux permease